MISRAVLPQLVPFRMGVEHTGPVKSQVTGILASRGRRSARDKEPGLDRIVFPFSTGSSEAD